MGISECNFTKIYRSEVIRSVFVSGDEVGLDSNYLVLVDDGILYQYFV